MKNLKLKVLYLQSPSKPFYGFFSKQTGTMKDKKAELEV